MGEFPADFFNKSILEDGASTAVETRREEDAEDVGATWPQLCPHARPQKAKTKSFLIRAILIRYNSTLAEEPLSLISYVRLHWPDSES